MPQRQLGNSLRCFGGKLTIRLRLSAGKSIEFVCGFGDEIDCWGAILASEGDSGDVLRKRKTPCFLACGPAVVVEDVLGEGIRVAEVRS